MYLNTHHWRKERPSGKLDNPYAGPFTVLERVGAAFRVDLPVTMKIHNVFPPNKLRKDPENPLPGQINELPPPVNITGEEEWELESVQGSRVRGKKLKYRLSWVGSSDVDLTWYDCSSAMYAPERIRAFHVANPLAAGPPARLVEWEEAFAAGREEYDDLWSNEVMSESSRTSFFGRGG